MSLQVSGSLNLNDAATECGISVTGLSMNDARVRFLADRLSGAIGFLDCYGKAFGNTITASSTSTVYGYGNGANSGLYGSIDRTALFNGPTINAIQWGVGTGNNEFQIILTGLLAQTYFTTISIYNTTNSLLRSHTSASATAYVSGSGTTRWNWVSPGQLLVPGIRYVIKLT